MKRRAHRVKRPASPHIGPHRHQPIGSPSDELVAAVVSQRAHYRATIDYLDICRRRKQPVKLANVGRVPAARERPHRYRQYNRERDVQGVSRGCDPEIDPALAPAHEFNISRARHFTCDELDQIPSVSRLAKYVRPVACPTDYHSQSSPGTNIRAHNL
jgi:hypothetical protein